jgi:hypothetical protein
MTEDNSQLIIIVDDKGTSADNNLNDARSKGSRSRGPYDVDDESINVTEVSIDAEKLKSRMSSFIKIITMVINDSDEVVDKKSGMQLEEIKLTVEVSGEGEFKIMGTGAKAGGKGAIELTFKRRS